MSCGKCHMESERRTYWDIILLGIKIYREVTSDVETLTLNNLLIKRNQEWNIYHTIIISTISVT